MFRYQIVSPFNVRFVLINFSLNVSLMSLWMRFLSDDSQFVIEFLLLCFWMCTIHRISSLNLGLPYDLIWSYWDLYVISSWSQWDQYEKKNLLKKIIELKLKIHQKYDKRHVNIVDTQKEVLGFLHVNEYRRRSKRFGEWSYRYIIPWYSLAFRLYF